MIIMKCSSENFSNLSMSELKTINGGMAPAALYALGFVMHTNPLAAIAACGGTIAAGIGAAVISSKKKDK